MKNPSQIDQNGAQKRSKNNLDNRSIPGTVPGRHRPLFPGPILRPWGDLGRHLGTQLNAAGIPESNVLATRRAKMSKNEVQNETSKKIRRPSACINHL